MTQSLRSLTAKFHRVSVFLAGVTELSLSTTPQEMENLKFEQRAVIKFFFKKNKPATEIHKELQDVYGTDALSPTQVRYWLSEFKSGRKSIEDEQRSGRPLDTMSQQAIVNVLKVVMEDRRLSVGKIAAECGLSWSTTQRILSDHLHLSKVSARWVPRNLSALDRQNRVDVSSELLALLNENEESFFHQIVTGDETWVHYYDPETKEQSKQWKHSGSPLPKKFRMQASAGKILATIFWDCEGILLIDYLPPKEKITGNYYAHLMKKLRQAIKDNRRGKLTRGVLLLHDNAPVHKSRVAQAAIRECGFEELNHPAYSPDLAPSDYYLFPNLKKHLKGKRYKDDNEVKSAVEAYLDKQSNSFYFHGLELLKKRWSKCIEVQGDYVEK